MLHGSVYNHHLNGFKNKLAGKVGSRILESTIDGECTFHALLRTVKPKSNTSLNFYRSSTLTNDPAI